MAAGKRISELDDAAALDGTEQIELVQAAKNVKGTTSLFARIAQLGTNWWTALTAALGAGWTTIFAGTYAAMRDEIAPIGEIRPWPGIDAPNANFALCDGAAVSRTTYATLYGRLTKLLGTCTISIASPGVVTLNTHGRATGDCVEFTTTGALPTGLSANTNYYVIYVDANTFRLATSLANALAGTAINTSGTQSGTHTLRYCPWGISGSDNFLLPDAREASFYGIGTRGSGVTAHDTLVLGLFADDRIQGHYHGPLTSGASFKTVKPGGSELSGSGGSLITYNDTTTSSPVTDGTNGTPRTGTTTRGKILGMNYIIRIK